MAHTILQRKRVVAFGAILATACMTLAACGSDDDKASGTPSASGGTSAAAAPTGEPIKIGYIASMSGPQAANGLGAQAVEKAWVKYTNANGGILGRPVQVDIVDSKNTVPGATAAAKTYLADSSIDVIFLTDLVAEGAMGETFKDTPVAIMSGGGSSDLLFSKVPGVFQDVSGSDYTIKAYAKAAQAAGAKKFGWAACAEVAVCTANGDKANNFAKTIGMAAGGNQQASASAADYTAQCLSFIGNGTDSIALNLGYATGTRFAADCIQQGYKGIFSVINSGFDQTAFNKVSGFKSVGGSNGFPWWSTDPKVKAYRDAMKQYSPDGTATSGNTTAIWSSFELLKKALEDAKPTEITRATVLDALYAVKNETLGGLLPEPITFTKGQPSKPVSCSWLFSFNAGDPDPKSVAPTADTTAGNNGQKGDLASTCVGY